MYLLVECHKFGSSVVVVSGSENLNQSQDWEFSRRQVEGKNVQGKYSSPRL